MHIQKHIHIFKKVHNVELIHGIVKCWVYTFSAEIDGMSYLRQQQRATPQPYIFTLQFAKNNKVSIAFLSHPMPEFSIR